MNDVNDDEFIQKLTQRDAFEQEMINVLQKQYYDSIEDGDRDPQNYEVPENDLGNLVGIMNEVSVCGCNRSCEICEMVIDMVTQLNELDHEQRILVIPALVIHAVGCTETNECTFFDECTNIREIIHGYVDPNFSSSQGRVLYSNSLNFQESEMVHISPDYNIFYSVSIAQGHFGKVSYQWIKRRQEQVAVAVKETRGRIMDKGDINLVRSSSQEFPYILFPQVIMQDQIGGVMFMEKGECSLYDYIKNISPRWLDDICAMIYIRQLLQGLNALHNVFRIHHGDIKTKNIIVMDNFQRLVFADFDSARPIGTIVESNEVGGTLGYIPFECVVGNSTLELDGSIDVYELAIVISELLLAHDMELQQRMINPVDYMRQRNIGIVHFLHQHRSKNFQFGVFVEFCLKENPSERAPVSAWMEGFQINFREFENQFIGMPSIASADSNSDITSTDDWLKCIIKKHMKELPKEFSKRPYAVLARDILSPPEDVIAEIDENS